MLTPRSVLHHSSRGRPYRHSATYDQARVEIQKKAGTQFDPQVVAAFLRITQHTWDEVRAAVERETPDGCSVMSFRSRSAPR
jgi:HD-GYP domain-containing protein (c-di-GMP phosphodiesterase class II)